MMSSHKNPARQKKGRPVVIDWIVQQGRTLRDEPCLWQTPTLSDRRIVINNRSNLPASLLPARPRAIIR
jgi:hypothetical protein